MGEFILKQMVEQRGMESMFEIASAATSREEIGNPVYPPAKKKLAEHGISCAGKTARQVTKQDYAHYDYLLLMDYQNVRNLSRMMEDPEGKVHLLMEYTGRTTEVADPWYTDDFDKAWEDISAGCKGFLDYLVREGKC